MKKCDKCSEYKENYAFSKRQINKPNGKCLDCTKSRVLKGKSPEELKVLRREYDEQYYLANRDKILANKQEYREENKEEMSEKSKSYYLDHKDERLAYNK